MQRSLKIQLKNQSRLLRQSNRDGHRTAVGPQDSAVSNDFMKHLYLVPLPHLVFKCRSDHLACQRAAIAAARRCEMMPMFFAEHFDPAVLSDRLRDANTVTPQLLAEVIDLACRRFPSTGQTAKTARIEELIDARAWTDVALGLIDLELPLWQIRRIAYDDGDWYCALSRERELPDWLDQYIEARHADLTLAILSAFVEAQRITPSESRPSVPATARQVNPLYEPICCDNFS